MATLTPEQKQYIVVRAAVFTRAKDIIKEFKEEYGFEPSPVQVHSLQMKRKPGDSKMPAKEYRLLFEATRAAFMADITAIPIANRAHRLQELNDLYYAAKDSKDLEMAADIIELASKEVGDEFTNKSKVEGKVDHEHTGNVDFAIAESRALLGDAFKRALEQPPAANTKH